ncbi:MAG TPA: dethiobiotin synthase [Acidimicrobiales bacterium]|nr:dethiobiotin synthase [Acidimicrobiales bacterium]
MKQARAAVAARTPVTGPGSRPPLVVVVAGTGTDVGKTWVACQLAALWRGQGLAVSARKPAQSFDPRTGQPTDADLLALATGQTAASVCPPQRWYPIALAPPMAAEAIGAEPFGLAQLAAEISWPAGAAIGLVEMAGGLGSPQASDGDAVDFVQLLAPDCLVLVSGAGLGCLTNIRLAERALGERQFVVYLNYFDEHDAAHAANQRWLESHTSTAVCTSVGQLAGTVLQMASAARTGQAGRP